MSNLLIRSAPLIGFRQAVLELEGDPEGLVKRVGLGLQVLDNPELIIPHDVFLRLLNLTAEETGCEYFGLLLSKHLDLSLLGPIGLLLQHSDTAGDALHLFSKYFPTRFQGQELTVQVEGELASLHSHYKATEEGIRPLMLLSAGVGFMLMKSLCGESWRPVELHSTWERPDFADILIQHLEAPVRFGQERNQMFFKASDLNKKISMKFGKFRRYLQPLIEEGDRLPEDIVSHTESLIRILLPEGKCSMENVTALLYTSERSLQRNLKAKGTSFRQLMDRIRKSIALQQLRHSDLSKSQLAYMLGYTELSAFTRAFKRWFGVAPSKWRSQ